MELLSPRLTLVTLLLPIMMELVVLTSGIRWLNIARVGSVATNDVLKSPEVCDSFKWLIKRQKALCRKNLHLMSPVTQGARRAIEECQHQFTSRRWNCSTVNTSSVFGAVLNQGTREAAFVHAISAAGVAYAVTRACSTGSVKGCGCDRTVQGTSPEGFHWAGCSDNIAYGNAFSRTFVDARERARGRQSSRALMNLHNNEAGRKAIEDNMEVQCKCHGVSGSCELKTCWRAMPSFRRIGDILKEKFDGGTEVQQKQFGSRRVLVPRNNNFKRHTASDIVYLESSPDFCELDPQTGSLGTTGRLCRKNSKAIEGCELMCCGRGFETTRRVVIERCHCKFQWCCTVKCQKCKREVEEHRCL